MKANKHNDSAVTWVNATLMQLAYFKVQEKFSVENEGFY